MAIALLESLHTNIDTPAGTSAVTGVSWTPGANELCFVTVSCRGGNTPAVYATSVTGNGLTWVKVAEKDDTQGAVNESLWRAMGASPSAGNVTVNFSVVPNSMSIQRHRWSGTDTTGTDGSGAIGAIATAGTGATDTATITLPLVTTRNNSWVFGFGTGRGAVWTKAAAFTNILVNQTASSAGNIVRSNTQYEVVATSGTTSNADWSLASANDWVAMAVEILAPGGTAYNQSVGGSVTPAGELTKRTSKALAGSNTPAGALVKRTGKLLSSATTPAGTLIKRTARALAGALTPSGALVGLRVIYVNLAGTVTPTGTLVKRTSKGLSGALTPAGALIKRTSRALAGALTPSGILTGTRTFIVNIGGTVAPTGSLTKRINKVLAGIVGSTGALRKQISKALGGNVTPTGTLTRAGAQAVIPQLPRGPIFSSNQLSYLVGAPAWGGGSSFFQDVTLQVKDYSQSSAALGGFWSASVSLRLPLEEMEDWLANGVGRQLTVKGRANTIVWEGIVDRVSLEVGGYSMAVGPYMDIANKVKLTYSIFLQLGGGNATGIRIVTEPTSNVSSIVRYGILEANFSTGGIDESEVTNLQAMLLDKYSFPGRSEDLSLPGNDRTRFVDVKLECVGYCHLLQKYLYNSETTGTQNLSAKLAAIVAAEPNGLFTSTQIETNTIQVPAWEDDDAEAWGLIKDLVAQGNGALERTAFGIYENRRVVYNTVGNNVIYIRPFREGANVIQDTGGGLLQPWQIRPGTYVWVSDLVPGKPLTSRLAQDPRVLYANTVQFRTPDQLVINGAHSFRIEQKLAQLGVSGIS